MVDGGSSDLTLAVAEQWGARILYGQPGRALQMNLGARHSQGRILLFLHADTCLPDGYVEEVESVLGRPGVVCGAFRMGIDNPRTSLKIIEAATNLRSRWLQMPYGDQAIFLEAERFFRNGGFRNLPIMEDFDFILRLRKQGRVALASRFIRTSARRWDKLGPWKTTAVNQIAILAFFAGVPLSRIAQFYNRRGNKCLNPIPSSPLSVCEQFGKKKETLRSQETSNRV